MAFDGVDQTRAQAVLSLISSDNEAREHFMSLYAGPGDALETLRRAADDKLPAANHTPSELHRRAFGRTHTPAEENAASAARAALASAEADRAADTVALLATITGVEEWATLRSTARQDTSDPSVDAENSRAAAPPSEVRRWALHPLVFASVVLGSMVIGALTIVLWTNTARAGGTTASSSAANASPAFIVTDGASGTDAIDGGIIKSSGPGSYTSAQEWFQRARKTTDTFPGAIAIDGLSTTSTRLIGGTPNELNLWVGKTGDERLCLIMGVSSPQDTAEFIYSCVNQQQFDAMGIGLHEGGYQAVWTGPTISVFSELTPGKN